MKFLSMIFGGSQTGPRSFQCEAPVGIGYSEPHIVTRQRIVVAETSPGSDLWTIEALCKQPMAENNFSNEWFQDGYVEGPSPKTAPQVVAILDATFGNRFPPDYSELRQKLMPAYGPETAAEPHPLFI